MNISVCIQHHPARAHLLEPLQAALSGAETVTDPEPDANLRSPFRTYMEALRRTPEGATHRLVVQDDAWPCDGFRDKMLRRVEERPGDMIAFFTPGLRKFRRTQEAALRAGQRWSPLTAVSWVPTVALLWPVEHAKAFLAFAEPKWGGSPREGDDYPVGMWAGRHRVTVWATVPNLVQHPDVEASLIGKPNQAGRNRARVAAMFDPYGD